VPEHSSEGAVEIKAPIAGIVMDDIGLLEREAANTPLHGVWDKGGPVFSQLSDGAVKALEGQAIASFGNAATLGMWAFATGLLLDGLFQIGVLPLQRLTVIFPVLIVYSGPVLFIVGLLLYRRNEAFLGSTFCSFGAFNLTRGILLLCMSFGLSYDVGTAVQGIMMEVFAYIALSLSIGGVRVNVVILLTLSAAFVGFLLSGPAYIADVVGHPGWKQLGQVGGGFLLAGCLFGYYGGSALLVNTAWRREILPIGGPNWRPSLIWTLAVWEGVRRRRM
jgi:succinate-acetate transporter protein